MKTDRVHNLARQTRLMFLVVECVVLLISASALADVLFALDWGYGWNDVLTGMTTFLASIALYWACTLIFRFMSRLGY